jgi:hypothetical protein
MLHRGTGVHGGVRVNMSSAAWPELDYARWRDTLAGLHLRTQVVGKVRLALTPWLNHGWQVPLYVTARGLGTSPIPMGGNRHDVFELEFDFIAQALVARTSAGDERRVNLAPQSIAGFYAALMATLRSLGVDVTINETPNEVPEPVAFSQDRVPRPYDGAAARAFWRALVQVDRVFKQFRTGYLGKASPVHFFWGSFDLAVTRFSGRRAPLHPGGVPGLPDQVTREAYSHEVSSAGFWPGNDQFPTAAFYSYAYPEPSTFRERPVRPGGARFDPQLGEFILPYETVRTAADPDAALMDFLDSTYQAAADAAGWDRPDLECSVGVPRRVRPIDAGA